MIGLILLYCSKAQISQLRKLSRLFCGISILVLAYIPISLSATESYIASYVKGNADYLDKSILYALAKRLEAKLGIQLKYRGATFARNLLLMQKGKSDIVAFLRKHPERQTYLHYIEPAIFNLNVAFIVRKGEHKTVQDYEDLYNLRIAALRSTQYFPRFTEDKRLKKSYMSSTQEGLSKLLSNHIDAFTFSEHIATYQIWKLGFQDKLELSDYVYDQPNPVFIALSKNAPIMQRLKEIEPIIQNMLESGEMRTVIEQFFSQRNLAIPDLW